MDFEALFTTGATGDRVPEGTYKVRVLDARVKEGKGAGTVFLDLEVLEGAFTGSVIQVNLYIPDGSEDNARGASFHFTRKTAGFVSGEVGRAMNSTSSPAPILAEAAIGKEFYAEIGVQEKGQYEGSNTLNVTKPLSDAAPAAAAPAPAAASAPTPVTVSETEDVPF